MVPLGDGELKEKLVLMEFSLKLQCFAKPGDIEDTELFLSATGKSCITSLRGHNIF